MVNAPLISINYAGMPRRAQANACAIIDPLFVYFEYFVVKNRINLQASTGSAHFTTQVCPAGHRRMPALQWIPFLCISSIWW